MGKLRVLVACEYSGVVREEFAALGHDAMSCDLLPSDKPGNHYQGDVMDVISDNWDLIIAHPPCTFLTIAAEWAYKEIQTKKIKPGTLVGSERLKAREDALGFIDSLWFAVNDNGTRAKLCIENPVGVIPRMRPEMPKPVYIHPYQFGENASKRTGLWLRDLKPLVSTLSVDPRLVCCGQVVSDKYGCADCGGDKKPLPRWGNQTNSGQNNLPPTEDRWKIRSTTYKGIAVAMANQWGGE